MKSDEYLALAMVASIFAAILVGCIGYVYNLVYIVQWSDGVGMLVLRCLGVVFAPLGAILGWVK